MQTKSCGKYLNLIFLDWGLFLEFNVDSKTAASGASDKLVYLDNCDRLSEPFPLQHF